ncbi:MAG: phosphatidate cytidylyltransferase [Vampirovibrionales bacterium]
MTTLHPSDASVPEDFPALNQAVSQALPQEAPLAVAKKPSAERVLMGFAVAGIAVLGMALGGWYLAVLVAFVMCAGFLEFARMMRGYGLRPSHMAFFTAVPILVVLAMKSKLTLFFPVLILGSTLAFFQWLFRRPNAKLADLSLTLLTLIYLGFLPAHLILLRNIGYPLEAHLPFWQQQGFAYLFLMVVMVSFSDIGAYYVGKRFGKALLYPEISPKKTREGTLGGLAVAVLVTVLTSWWLKFPLHHALLLCVLMVITGGLGDLVESKIKRESGVKDSGSLLAGHGGVLDRMDSYLFSGAVAYYYIHWVVLQEGLAEKVVRLFSFL